MGRFHSPRGAPTAAKEGIPGESRPPWSWSDGPVDIGRRTSGTLAAPGACLHYDARGGGPALLVVPPAAAAPFAALAEAMAGRRTVITYDRRGVDRSRADGPPPAGEGLDTDVDDARRLLDHLALGPADVLGGRTALALLERHPDLVRTLVAHEPATTARLDLAALKTVSDRLVLTRGTASPAAPDAASVLGEAFGLDVVALPGGPRGYATHPEEFARALLALLDARTA